METRARKIQAKQNSKIFLKVIPGHFATNHSHINYYMDMTTLKTRQTEAAEVAKTMAREYKYNTVVDTIICMDGCEVIGTQLAQDLAAGGIMCMNTHQSMYVITPQINTNGQLIFQDNIRFMVEDKNVLLLVATAATGKTIAKSLECIQYYGGQIRGISTIFSATKEIFGHKVNSIFTPEDLPDYQSYSQENCPHCKNNEKIDAIVNGQGYSALR